MGEGGSVVVGLEVTAEQHLVVEDMQVVADLEVDVGHYTCTVVEDTLIVADLVVEAEVAGLEVTVGHHAVVEGTKVADG